MKALSFKKDEVVLISGESLELRTFGTGPIRCRVVRVSAAGVRIRDPKGRLWLTPAWSLRRAA